MEIPGVGPVEGPWDLCDVDAYLGHIELKGKRVLEIGPASGFLTFTMERRGATVVSLEQLGWPHFDIVPRPEQEPEALAGPATEMFEKLTNGFWFTHRAFGSSAQVHYGNAYNLPDALGVFDISVVGCVLLHNRDPMKILQQCAERTTEQLVVVEPLGPDTGRPVARLLPAADNDFVDGWWALTPEFISQALGLLGFAHRTVVLHEQRHRTEQTQLFTVVGSR
jgi:O-methyltransferase